MVPGQISGSVLEAPLGLDIVQDLLQLLILKPTLQTETRTNRTLITQK